MKLQFMALIRFFMWVPVLGALLTAQRLEAAQDDFFGWYTVSASGDLRSLSPALERFLWSGMLQTRLGNDSTSHRETLLFTQAGYALAEQISLWLGYTHDWLEPAKGKSFDENRSYEDFLWRGTVGPGRLAARSRFEQRFRDPGGDVGWRFRQMFEYVWPVPGVSGLNLVTSEEVFVYLNSSVWGDSGFTENRAIVSLAYRIDRHVSFGLGYMNQFISRVTAPDALNHTLLLTMSFNWGGS